MPEGSPFTKIILLFVLIALNALFAMSEIAVISLNDAKLKHQAQSGNKKAKILVRLTAEPSRFLATIQVGVTLSGMLSSAVAADTFTDYIVRALAGSSIPPNVIRMISIIVITMLLAYINLVLGELVPKRIAMNNPEKISFGVSGILRVTSAIARPFVVLLSASTNGILRLIGIDPNKGNEDVTEEEIRMMIDVGEEDGTIEQTEREMLHNIFEFDDRTATEIMTHRINLLAIDIDATLRETIDCAVSFGHTRLPVYDGSLDNIVGVLNVKDLLPYIVQPGDEFSVRRFMRPVLYVPESSHADAIMNEFRTNHSQIAVVVDEYGGTAGIVTMEDLLESIVGNIRDEFDVETDEIQQLSEDEYLLDGTALLIDLTDEMNINFPDNLGVETIAGFISNELRHLPQRGESVSYGGFTFTVIETGGHRVTAVTAKRDAPPDPPAEK